MNKTKLIKEISKYTLTKKDAKNIVNLIFNNIKNSLISGEKVVIQNFGTFISKFYKSKKMYEPKRKKYIPVEPRRRIKFLPSKAFLKILNAKQIIKR
ncbi:MAG: HU family DNA-binding protein [Endomicrobia bacterium]|nr:HU family DNA-binding protein [Endomicrobiia bacterium]